MEAARAGLVGLAGTELIAFAEPVETDPVGPVEQGAYLNSAAVVRTTLSPRELLAGLLAIERAAGRDRSKELRWGPRTLDLDLLLYGQRIIDEPGLAVPHPRMHERAFVLGPLASIAPHIRHPTLGQTIGELLASLDASGA